MQGVSDVKRQKKGRYLRSFNSVLVVYTPSTAFRMTAFFEWRPKLPRCFRILQVHSGSVGSGGLNISRSNANQFFSNACEDKRAEKQLRLTKAISFL
jgi:hypothetical protein